MCLSVNDKSPEMFAIRIDLHLVRHKPSCAFIWQTSLLNTIQSIRRHPLTFLKHLSVFSKTGSRFITKEFKVLRWA